MANKRKKRVDPIIILSILLILFIAAAVGAQYILRDIDTSFESELGKLQEDAKGRNQDLQDEFDQQMQAYNTEVNQLNQDARPTPAPSTTEGWAVVEETNYPLKNATTVSVTRDEAMFGGLLLVNQWHTRPDDFDESQMLSINTYAKDSGLGSFYDNSDCKLHPVAIDALVNMLKAAQAEGLQNFVVRDGYNFRTYEEQDALFQAEREALRRDYSSLSEDELTSRALQDVNYAGTSEFNTGLSFCLYLYEREDAEKKQYFKKTPFYETENGQWLLEHAWEYGFVFRFPTGSFPVEGTVSKQHVTGMSKELNCYRYVGEGHAAVMHHLNLCLEEYIDYLAEKKNIAVYENGRLRYRVTYQYVGDDAATFDVVVDKSNRNYTMSLDNFGGLITVYSY